MTLSIVEEIVNDGGYTIEDGFLTPSPWCRPGQRISPIGGVIHWTANLDDGSNAYANRNYWNGLRNQYASAHTLSDSERIIAALPYLPGQAEMGYHVGAQSYRTDRFGTYPNRTLLGHEICVNRDGDFRESYKRGVYVMAYWTHIYGWDPHNDIARHYDITGKCCPLPFIDAIWDDGFCAGIGFNAEQTKWMRDNLHIDGIQGDALFRKFIDDVAELSAILNEGGIEMVNELKAENVALAERLCALEAKATVECVPDWACEAVDAAVAAGLVDTPNGGSYDFYRLITVLHRKGIV